MTLSAQKIDGEFTFNDKNFYSSSFNTRWFSELNIQPNVILDIGAYDFGDSIRFKQEYPTCKIYGFEADKSRYDMTHMYAESCGINTLNCAVYKNTGTVKFYPSICTIKDAGTFHTPGTAGGQGSIYKHNSKYKQQFGHIIQDNTAVDVNCIDVNFLCKKENITDITLAHIDAEGAELDILLGFKNIRPKLLFIELQDNLFENNTSKDEIFNLLSSMGYSLIKDCGIDKLYIHTTN
jgi:FkbM family methyltransferase